MALGLSRLILLLGYAISFLGALSLFPYLPFLPRLVLVLGAIAGLVSERRARPLLLPSFLTAAALILFAGYAVQLSRSNPVLPVVSILAILLGTRLAAEKTPRTWLQTSAIALVCLAASSLFNLGPVFLVLLGSMLPLIALLLVLLTFQTHAAHLVSSHLRPIILIGLAMPLAALILTPLFFPILPRTQLPLWNFLQQAGGSQPSGLSDTVTPGTTAQVPSSGLLVFRAELPRLAPHQLYWRGPTFSRLNGLQWQKDPAASSPPQKAGLTTVHQAITLEPGAGRTLIGLDMPVSFSDHQGRPLLFNAWSRPLPASRRLRYEVWSAIDRPSTDDPPTFRHIQLPESTPARLRQLASQLRHSHPNDKKRLQALEDWFRTNNFRYSRSDLPTGDNALERFLFETRSGHCEFFASGFALVARGAGLPSRLVGGYYGGEYNDMGGYYRISEERAHVWVEVWLKESGWLRIDPSSFAVNADVALGEPRQRSLFKRLRLLVDSFEHTWTSTIITYDFERQLQAATRAHAHLQSLTPLHLRAILWPAFFLAFFAAMLRVYRQLHQSGLLNRDVRLLRRFRRQIERDFGIPRNAPLGLLDIARQLNAPRVNSFVACYTRALYRDQPLNDADYHTLSLMLRTGLRSPDRHR